MPTSPQSQPAPAVPSSVQPSVPSAPAAGHRASEHTPTPWAVSKQPGSRGVIICPSLRGYRGGDRNVARCSHSDLAGCARIPEAEANAKLIVEAVNQHAALLAENRALREALTELRADCQNSRRFIDLSNDEGFECYNATARSIIKADAALSLGKGEGK